MTQERGNSRNNVRAVSYILAGVGLNSILAEVSMPDRVACGLLLLGTSLIGLLGGCKKASPAPTTPSMPVVLVSNPVQRQVSDYVEYTGRLDAIQSARIT